MAPVLPKEEVKLCQRAIGEMAQVTISADGQFGPLSRKALLKWQGIMNLEQTGEIDDDSYAALKAFIDYRYVRTQDIADAAKEIGVQPSMLLALSEKESIGAGFLYTGQPIILFEGHKFYEYTAKRIGKGTADSWASGANKDICFPQYDPRSYVGGLGEWARFERARLLDATCAMLSTSWGRWQMMGFNYDLCGFKDVQTFVDAMTVSEKRQLEALEGFIRSKPRLYNGLRNRNFQDVALIYNGASYRRNYYDTILMQLEEKYKQYR